MSDKIFIDANDIVKITRLNRGCVVTTEEEFEVKESSRFVIKKMQEAGINLS